MLNQVEEWVKAGIKVYSCYEAGACGYWYHRELVKRGAINYVVAQAPGESTLQRSEDRSAGCPSALGHLESYLRGNRETMSLVAVPNPEIEQQRSVVRYRQQLMCIDAGLRREVGPSL